MSSYTTVLSIFNYLRKFDGRALYPIAKARDFTTHWIIYFSHSYNFFCSLIRRHAIIRKDIILGMERSEL